MARKIRGTLYRRGKTFWLEYTANGERFRQSLGVTTKREAERERERILAPLLLGTEAERRKAMANALASAEEQAAAAIEAARPRLALAEVWDRHPYTVNTRGTTERKLSESSIRDFKALWERFTGWAEGQGIRNVEDVTTLHVEAFRRHLADAGISADRQNKVCLTARVMFRAAGVSPNPFDGLRKLAHKAQGRRELTAAELQAVCGSAAGELRPLYALGLYCGFRLGDACTLEWSEVKPDLSRIIREPSKTRYKGTELVIPVHPVLAAILAETPPEQRKGPVVPGLCAEYRHDSAVVVRRIGKHFEACGIRLHKDGTGEGTGKRAVVEVGFHSLRHSFVSLSARQGVPLHVIQALCGHSTPAIQRLYLHHSGGDVEHAIGRLPDVTAASKALPAAATAKARLAGLVANMGEGEAARWCSEIEAARARNP